MPFTQSNLLRNIIETADTVSQTQATLRFGHEVCVMPLACLLELGTSGAQVSNLDELDEVWRNYRIFPMACNIQLVFYRKDNKDAGDILVKALLNEREVSLPVSTTQYPYYKWSELRQYYLNKLAEYDAKEKAWQETKAQDKDDEEEKAQQQTTNKKHNETFEKSGSRSRSRATRSRRGASVQQVL